MSSGKRSVAFGETFCRHFNAPFLVDGGLKIVYDLLLYRNFRKTDVR